MKSQSLFSGGKKYIYIKKKLSVFHLPNWPIELFNG